MAPKANEDWTLRRGYTPAPGRPTPPPPKGVRRSAANAPVMPRIEGGRNLPPAPPTHRD
jgi:hypothetical protein